MLARNTATHTCKAVFRSALLAALCLPLAACHKNKHARNATSPISGGTLIYATDREPVCLDPHVQGDMPQVFVAQQYLDSLVSMDKAGGIHPWLASSWDISSDGLAYTFHLRSDVTFTDGTPFTAEAVKVNLDHMANPATQSSTAGGYIRQYHSTEIVDAHTAIVHLSRPYAAFLEVLAQGFLGIESPKALARPRDLNCQAPVGSGPFRIVRWDRQNRILFERNPAYHWAPSYALHNGPAYLNRIEWRFIPEPSARFAALQAAEVDAIDTLPPEAQTPAQHNADLWLLMADRPGNPTNGTLNTRRAPFNDARVREAFLRSADIEGALESVFFHHYRRAGGPLTPTTPFYSPDFEHAADYNPQRANILLDQAGWSAKDADGIRTKEGHRLTVHIPLRSSLSNSERTLWEQVQATARETGFDVLLENADDTSVNAREGQWDYDVRIGYWNTNTADVLRIVFSSEFLDAAGISGHHQNESGFSNPYFDRIVNEALLTTDTEQRRNLYYQAQKIASAAFLQITTFPQTTRLAISKRVHDIRLEPALNVTTLYDAWVEQ